MLAGSRGDGGEVAASGVYWSQVGNINSEGKVKTVMQPGCKMIVGDQPPSSVMQSNREVTGTVRMKVQGCRSSIFQILIFMGGLLMLKSWQLMQCF